MNRVLTTCIFLALLPVLGNAQATIVKDATSAGYNTGTSVTIAHTNNGSLLVTCVLGDVISGGHDDVSATYNGTSMLLVDKFSTDTVPAAERYGYMFKLASPATGNHNIIVSATNGHLLDAASISYTGAADLSIKEEKVFGPVKNTSPWYTSVNNDIGGAGMVMCDLASGAAAYSLSTKEVSSPYYNTPTVFDYLFINPANRHISMGNTVPSGAGSRIQAEIIPGTPFALLQKQYVSSNSWVFNATDSNLPSCSYDASAWDTTTAPYTDITSSITSNTCDGSYNVTIGFSGNHTGTLILVPNPTQCGAGTC
jgi:hypothetical protein